ncbi:MAG: hypothetical protein FIB08_07650 [Candidatus Methanoperedens sp.]|nr:hypothetical protein [Candidatus Methanoperedens sp.]
MGQITIRIDDELEKLIDQQRGDKPKSDFYREILTGYVNKPDCNLTATPRDGDYANQKLIEQLSGQVRFLEGKLDEANRLLLNEQTLHLATQRLLPPAQNKPWYKFWK